MSKVDVDKLGTVAKAIRQMNDLEQSDVCQRANIDNGSLSRFERGKQTIGIERLQKIVCDGLGSSLPKFFAIAQEMSE